MKELIYHTKKSLVIPTEWNELSANQLIAIAEILDSSSEDTNKLIRALHVCTGMGKIKFNLLPTDVIVNASTHIDWVFKENTLTQNLLPELHKMYGPDGNFDNLQMHEFNHAEIAYQELVATEDDAEAAEYLNRLVAILYREGKRNYNHERNPDGEHRIAFSYGDIAFNTKKVIAKFSKAEKLAVLLWYDGCRQALVKMYPLVFSGKGGGENMYDGLFSLIHSVAGDKYGSFDQVESSYAHKVLMALSILINEANELEKSMRNE